MYQDLSREPLNQMNCPDKIRVRLAYWYHKRYEMIFSRVLRTLNFSEVKAGENDR